MNTGVRWLAVVLLVTGLCGCKGGVPGGSGSGGGGAVASKDPQTISKEQALAMEEVTSVLSTITSDEYATAALPKLEKASDRLKAANMQMAQLQKEWEGKEKEAEALFNTPDVQAQMERVMEAAGKMMDANLNARLKAPGKRKEIQTICDRANVEPKSK